MAAQWTAWLSHTRQHYPTIQVRPEAIAVLHPYTEVCVVGADGRHYKD